MHPRQKPEKPVAPVHGRALVAHSRACQVHDRGWCTATRVPVHGRPCVPARPCVGPAAPFCDFSRFLYSVSLHFSGTFSDLFEQHLGRNLGFSLGLNKPH